MVPPPMNMIRTPSLDALLFDASPYRLLYPTRRY